MEDLLKMPSQYVDQVMYSVRAQQQRHRSSLIPTRETKGQTPIDKQQQQQQQQRLRSAMTPTTQSTTSASNDS